VAPRVGPGFRGASTALFLVCLAALGFAWLWLERTLGLEPCPLCLFDRIALGVAGLVCLAAAVHAPRRVSVRRLYAGLATLLFAGGIAIGGRHVWLQQLPAEEVPACGPDLAYMFDVFPLLEALDMVLSGSGSCAEIDAAFLGINLAQWTLGLFVVLTGFTAYLFVRAGRMD